MLNKPRELAIVPVDMEKFTPNDCLGKLFISKDNVMSKPDDFEDLLKSNMWFGSKPIDIVMFGESGALCGTKIIDTLNVGDWYMWMNNQQICQAEGDIEEMRILWKHLANGQIKKIVASTNVEMKLAGFTEDFIGTFFKSYRSGNQIKSVNVQYTYSAKRMDINWISKTYFPKTDNQKCVVILPQKQNYTRDEVVELFEIFTAKVRDLAFDKITLVNLTPDEFIKQNLI